MKLLSEIHKECHRIFIEGFYENPFSLDGNYGRTKACEIYQKLTEGTDKCDSIGEHFNQLLHKMNFYWFERYVPIDNDESQLSDYFMTYVLRLYLFVERVDLIFAVMSNKEKCKNFQDFLYKELKTLRQIKRWANFIKHPKEFLFTHWPLFYIEGSLSVVTKENDVVIDTNFIMKHYAAEHKDRPFILENNTSVFVEIPNFEELTNSFCKEMNLFFDFICQNQRVADFLKEKSTVENYFIEENDASRQG